MTDDRPKIPSEIEITPAMIKAGVEVAWGGPLEYPNEKNLREMVRQIFVAMSQAQQ